MWADNDNYQDPDEAEPEQVEDDEEEIPMFHVEKQLVRSHLLASLPIFSDQFLILCHREQAGAMAT